MFYLESYFFMDAINEHTTNPIVSPKNEISFTSSRCTIQKIIQKENGKFSKNSSYFF